MPALFVFLLKVNIALLLFCAGYYFVLRHLTFYTLNRVYLLAAILFASIYPQINLSDFLQRHQQLARPVQQVVINWQAPAQALATRVDKPNYWVWVEGMFWLGAALLAIRLFIQLFSLYKLYRDSQPATIGDHQVRLMDQDAAPFSFWQSIFVNPANHEPADLKAILLHEQVHVNQWHTADILLAELSSIFYWFNPGIWLIKRAVRENIEFITDQKILKKGIDSKTYQYSLVSVSFNNTQPGIVNHFNLSTIKKRIIMMNAKRSSKINLTRYAVVVPVVVALLLVFSISKAEFVKRSAAYKSIATMSATVGKAVGVNRVVSGIASILPETQDKPVADTTKFDAEYIKNSSDALWYLDGEPLSKDKGFGDDTESINYVSAADAKKYFNAGDGKHMIAFATTKSSAIGKVLRERIAGLVSSGKIRTMSVAKGTIDNVNNKVALINAGTPAYVTTADTVRKSKHFSIVTNSDSSIVYINGKRGKIKDVDPDDVLSVNVFDAKGAAPFVAEKVGDNVAVIFITTKNSPEGLKFREKLNVNGDEFDGSPMNTATVTGFGSSPIKGKATNVMIYDVKLNKDSLTTTATGKSTPGTLVYINGSGSQKSAVAGSKVTAVRINGTTTNLSSNNNVVDGDAISTSGTGVVSRVFVTGRKNSNLHIVNGTVATMDTIIMTAQGNPITIVDSKNGITGTSNKIVQIRRHDNQASPLILVDGKEVSEAEFKSVEPGNIKSINVLKDAKITQKYGEKAKQGVIMIELKKK